MMFGYAHDSWAGWEIALMWTAMIAVVALISWAVARTVCGGGSGRPVRGPVPPGQILDKRLAGGEIDADQYARLRDALNSGGARPPAGSSSRN